MPKSHRPYAPEFRMVDLVRSGRTPEELSREFEPTAQAIWNWVRQADRDEGRRDNDAGGSLILQHKSRPCWLRVRALACSAVSQRGFGLKGSVEISKARTRVVALAKTICHSQDPWHD